MAVPKKLLIDIESYPSLTFLPLGRKNKSVRSLANDHTKGVLTRLNKAVEVALSEYVEDDIQLLQAFLYDETKGGLPVPITKQEEVYPYLWKADAFLWRTFSEQKGIPIHSNEFYTNSFVTMTKEQLETYIKQVIKSYMFCARIHDTTRRDWLGHVNKRFHEHPIVALYHKNRDDIVAIEAAKTSPLLFLMKNPDQIAFWRSRIEIIMRPFRSMSLNVFEQGLFACPHEMTIDLNENEETMRILCDKCGVEMTYHVADDIVTLKDDYNVILTSKRLHTTRRQFTDIMKDNPHVVDKLYLLQEWKQILAKQQPLLTQLKDIYSEINDYMIHSRSTMDDPFLHFLFKVKRSSIPDWPSESMSLPWFAEWHLDDISMMNELYTFNVYLQEEKLIKKLHESVKEATDTLEETKQAFFTNSLKVGRIDFSPVDLHSLLQLVKEIGATETQQTYIAILSGQLSSTLRRKQYDQLTAYSMLKQMKQKYLLNLFSQLQEWQLIQKERVGFSLTTKGQRTLQLLAHHE
ncbi:RQC-minor-2 family DNA-binding protein [Metabacillus iocasae]|uniref:RQC domain-containing protein n=1 Tax=Priestia iocasae TaxID=2291674 RepID=A0ABS2QW85_9BACI|nr:RQC-minor-2 family DNA-binding protein [Metabacillus iocasae]MBM7703458.1 hypothetical protein [Metabacillus iocasae]